MSIPLVGCEAINKEGLSSNSRPTPPPRSTETKQNKILDIKSITSESVDGRKFFTDVSFSVFESEILGIAGVEGNGQKEVVESIIGIQNIESGEIFFNGENINNKTTRQRLESGISFIPEDRQLQAMIMDMNLTNNVIIGAEKLAILKLNFIFLIQSYNHLDLQGRHHLNLTLLLLILDKTQ